MLSDMIEEELLCELKSKKSINITRDFRCEQCEKKFQKQAHLVRHIKQRHQNQRIYQCSFENCEKTFKRDTHLKRHMISHTHQKPHKCDKCIMAFGYKHHLDRHVKVIHNNQLLQCPECQQKFTKRKALSKHYSKAHGNGEQKSNNITQSSSKKQMKKNKKIKKHKNTPNNKKDKEIKFSESSSSVQKNLQIFQEESSSQIQMEQNQRKGQNSIKNIQSQQLNNDNDQQNKLFRCIYIQCPIAFKHKHQLCRHIQRVDHSEMTLIEDNTIIKQKRAQPQQKTQKLNHASEIAEVGDKFFKYDE